MSFESVGQLVQAIRRSGLLDQAQIDEVTAKLSVSVRDAWSLAELLIRRDWLTVFQVQQLSEGNETNLVIGPYRILDRLGEGGVSHVYKAWHRERNYPVALKVVHAELLSNAEILGRFRREMKVVGALSHPNIIKAFDVQLAGRNPYFAMEFVEGMDLDRMVKLRGPLPVSQSCGYIHQAALGLQHIHENQLVHRDVKPANLVVTSPDSVVKILDLGLARLHLSAESDGKPLTREGILIGSPDYLAPEQAADPRNVDIRADVYGLGCTFYYLLTGQPPFPGGSLLDKVRRHQLVDAACPDLLRPGVQQKLQRVQQKMMAKKPADRFQTPQEVADALKPFCPPKPKSRSSGVGA